MVIDPGGVREKLGELVATVKEMREQYRDHRQFIAEQLSEHRVSRERMEERLTNEIKNVRAEQRQDITAQSGKLELLGVQVRDMAAQTKTVIEDIEDFGERIDRTTADVSSLKGLRQNIVSYGAGALAVIAVIAWFIGPFFSSLATSIIAKVTK